MVILFMTLLGKVLPTQVDAKVDMQPGYLFKIETVEGGGEGN